jgi:type IV secretory pathway TrbF-like protein
MEQMFQTMEKPMQDNPYQKASEAWNKQMQQMMQQWQNLFKS